MQVIIQRFCPAKKEGARFFFTFGGLPEFQLKFWEKSQH